MRRRAGRACPGAALAILAAFLAGAPSFAQEPPLARPGQEQPDASRPLQSPPLAGQDMPRAGDVGDLAGPALAPPAAPADRPPPVQPVQEGGVPLRVVPPAPLAGATADALGRAVLIVDQEAMYRRSRWGLRAQAELAAQSRQVAADNDRAFAALVADEDALTAARATLPPEEFRARAARFDERVTAVREEREAARNALTETAERDRALFFQAAAPVLGRLMTARGALVVLDQRTVLIADERIDVTDATIAALDAELGDGREIIAAALRAQSRTQDEAGEDEVPPEDAARPDGGAGATPAPAAAPEAGAPAADTVPADGATTPEDAR